MMTADNLLRELAIRAHLAFPCNDAEEKWWEQGTDISKCGDFKKRLFKAINEFAKKEERCPMCGRTEPCDGISLYPEGCLHPKGKL